MHFHADYLWAITPTGAILCRDLLALDHVETETDPECIWEALKRGAKIYPDLRVLLPS
ncbi:MAG: hypothetical protein JNN12_11730 [Bacteroidetes Order II. Incertae sedis bacterium]|nr:hypothetical protein [Bacteroidetes Order II. bacterium]